MQSKPMFRAAAFLAAFFMFAGCQVNAAGNTFGLPFRPGTRVTGAAAAAGTTYTVPATCAQPPTTQSGTNYYVDAATGNDSNNGLAPGSGHAWLTLAHAIATVPIAGGDTINLYTGTYTGALNRNLTAFDLIVAVVGQTPKIATILSTSGGSKWIVRGITFQAQRVIDGSQDYDPLISVSGTSSNIVFYGNDLSSDVFATVSGWTAANWASKARWEGIDIEGGSAASPTVTCITVNNNTIHYIQAGVIGFADKIMIDSNTMDWNSGDYIDYSGNNITMSNNIIKNSIDDQTLKHADGIQAQVGNCPLTQTASFTGVISGGGTVLTTSAVTGTIGTALVPGQKLAGAGIVDSARVVAFVSGVNGGAGVYTVDSTSQGNVSSEAMTTTVSCNFSNILINANAIIEKVDASVPHTSLGSGGDAQQGISGFDLDWSNVTITNNIVTNSSAWGISCGSCHTATIANNVVMATTGANTDAVLEIDRNSHQGGNGTDINVFNNITTNLNSDRTTPTLKFYNNLAKALIAWDYNGASPQFISSPSNNTDPNGGLSNVFTATAVNSGIFLTYDAVTPSFDFHLKAASPAIGTGTAVGAPNKADGTARSGSVDEGAY